MAYRQMKEHEELMANSEWSEGGFLPLPSAISHKLRSCEEDHADL